MKNASHNKKNSHTSNNKRRNATQKRVSKNVDTTDNCGKDIAPNNPLWYGNTPEIIRDTASFSYGYPVGRAIDSGNTTNTTTYGKQFIDTPGVMAFYIEPAIGYSDNSNSPINIAARNLYSWVRHANSGHTNYDAPDLMLYVLAMDSLYSMYSWGCRIYGLIRQYSHVNRYWPRAILAAEAIDYASFEGNIANFRYFLDIMCKKIGSMCVPNSFTYTKRHAQCYSEVYTDAPVLKAQMYLYTPRNFWRYNETSGAGKLESVLVRGAQHFTYNDFVTLANSLIDAVIASEDLNIMSGDILKAFGQDNLVKLSYVPIEYEAPIMYSSEMLSQIQNLTICGVRGQFDVTQNPTTGALLFTPYSLNTVIEDKRKIITMVKEDVSPAETLVATRLTAFPKKTTTGNNGTMETLGSEWCTSAHVVYFDHFNSLQDFFIYGDGICIDTQNPTTNAARLANLTMIEKFNQHPLIYVCEELGSLNSEVIARLQDIDNYTIIEEEELKEMNEGALLTMFAVPQLGMWSATYGNNKS